MKYRILWFDDSEEFVNTHKETIGEYVNAEGFELEVIPREDDENLQDELHKSQADLILMDYNLSNAEKCNSQTTDATQSVKGDKVIKQIRNYENFVETILYSRDAAFRSKIDKHLEGVYFADWTGLPEKAKKIISLTIKKQQKITNLRGLIISEAIDIVTQLEELIIKMLNVQEPPVNMKLFNQNIMHSEFFNDNAKYTFVLSFLKKKQKS